MVGVKPVDTATPKIAGRKDLFLAASKKDSRDHSPSRVSSLVRLGKF